MKTSISKHKSSKNAKYANQSVIKKANRELIVNINMFLLGSESLRGLFWTVANIDFNPSTKSLKISITTTDNKLGTTLEKMRKSSKDLATYLYEAGAVFCIPRIYFSVFSKDEDEFRVEEFLETVNTNV